MANQIIAPPAYQRPTGKLYLGTDQLNLVSGTPTKVELDTIPSGYADGIEDTVNHRITPGQPGFYSLVGQVTFQSPIADKAYYALLMINGSPLFADVGIHSAQAAALAVVAALPCHYFDGDDYIELWAQSFAEVDTVDIESTESRTFLALQRVR